MNMPRGTGAKQRRGARRSASRDGVEGARRALDSAPDGLTAAALATDDEIGDLIATLAPKVGTCTNCTHMAAKHQAGGTCTVEGCSCTQFEAEASESAFDAVDYAGTGADLAVVGFEPSPERLDAAIAELTHRSPDAEPLVRFTLENLRLRRFVDSPAPALTPPLDAGGERFTLEWDAILCPEGKLTEDGRAFAPGSIRWRELPLSLAAMLETQPGHDGAKVCGRIDRIWRDDTAGMIRAAGVFDDSHYGREIARLVADGILRGNSVDIAPLEVEVGPQSRWFDPEGNWIPQEASAQQDEPSLEDVLFGDPAEPTIVVVNDAVIGMSTVCPFPAFADAHIKVGESIIAAGNPLVWTLRLDAGYRLTRSASPEPEALTAAVLADSPAPELSAEALGLLVGLDASEIVRRLSPAPGPVGHEGALGEAGVSSPPVNPPAAWFTNPNLNGPTALVVTEEGQIFGHAATWGTCHTGFPDVCVTPPSSETEYRFFHLKQVVCDEGIEFAVGTITLEAPHANQSLGLVDASAHYDHTGLAAADVVVGEDEHGIWVAGAARSHLTPEMLRELRGAVLSGDWRNYEGNLELVALLAVNVPGFPIPRVQTRVAAGVPQALTAAGVLDPEAAAEEGPGEWLPPAVDAATAAKLAALASIDLLAVAE